MYVTSIEKALNNRLPICCNTHIFGRVVWGLEKKALYIYPCNAFGWMCVSDVEQNEAMGAFFTFMLMY